MKNFNEEYKNSIICKYRVNITTNTKDADIVNMIKNETCAGMYFKSEPFGGRCIPSILIMFGKELYDEMANNTLIDNNNVPVNETTIKDTNK